MTPKAFEVRVCGYMMWLSWSDWKIITSQLHRAGETENASLATGKSLFLWGVFMLLKVDFACFAFLFLPAFTDEPLLGFVSFPLLSAVLVLLCWCCKLTALLCWCFDASCRACPLIPNNAQRRGEKLEMKETNVVDEPMSVSTVAWAPVQCF